jgi:hypothetical protein
MIKINADDLYNFSVKLDKKASNNQNVKEAIRKSTLSIESKAKSNLTSNGSVVTGHLRRSVTHKLNNTEGIVHTSNVKYARGVEEGVKPHIIRPKNKKALYWAGAKHPVKSVNHKGSKAKPYLIPAFEEEKPKFMENLKEAIKLD